MKKKHVSLLLAAAMAASVISGCGNSANNSAAETEKTETTAAAATSAAEETTAAEAAEDTEKNETDEVVIATPRDAVQGSGDAYYCWEGAYVWEALTANNGGVIDPWLAKSWEHNDDCTEWTFNLRDDAYFTDGVQFNADVCLKNIERWGHGITSTYTTLSIEKSLPNLDKMEKVDDFTVKFTFTQPITTLEYVLSDYGSPMYSPNCFDEETGVISDYAIGTGPYKIVDHVESEYVTLERNDNYYGENGKVKTFKIRCIPDAETRVSALKSGEVMTSYGWLRRGFEYRAQKFIVVTEGDIFGAKQKRRKKKIKKFDGKSIQSFNELNVGDYVVHEEHGLGIYRGIEKIRVENVTKDFFKIEYGDGGNLYVPVSGLDVLQKYAGQDVVKKPKLNKLNSSEWKKTKSRVKHAVNEVAKELVLLYAKRQQTKGYCFGKDTVWQTEFEDMFPFDETKDQLDAIDATKKDMESNKVMDRLICGDVGYGKTEIAIRAAFKAANDGKQVAFLVPTTILAQQHYNTFKERLGDYPVRVEMLSRFRTPAQQKKALEGLKKGDVDIIIGTHRLLSKDVEFKDLGLLIVDEEQRFGVAHKEKIKQIKGDVDVLTLSATPIPRTLHMSLAGIRDMSVLEEPPVDRLPIQTFVMEHNPEIIREAINRELARNGQIFYVYNRVKGIDVAAMEIQKLVPDANVAYAHGQMSERQLEKIMMAFINGEIDVMVATTIIETGLDISNVNTIIIDNADQMGLSQLYQLRGRVGRSNRNSYAFLMYKRNKVLKEIAEKRLAAIKEFTELGSGIKVAMRDLEIRGAGNLLGEAQSGHMEAVGYDLYCKMLNEAVHHLKGDTNISEEFETEIDINVNAHLLCFQ